MRHLRIPLPKVVILLGGQTQTGLFFDFLLFPLRDFQQSKKKNAVTHTHTRMYRDRERKKLGEREGGCKLVLDWYKQTNDPH